MASEAEASAILEQLLGGGGGRGARFFPVLISLLGLPPADGEAAAATPTGRIVLVNPLTQGMVVLQGDVALMSEILSEGAGREGPPPASKASIEALRTVEAGEVEVEECTVCLDGLGGGDPGAEAVAVKEMPCKHRFHGGCIEKWLGMHGSCPICRFQMPVEEEGSKKIDGGEGEERGEGVAAEEEEEPRRMRRREMWIAISVGRQGRRDQEHRGDGDEAGEED